MRLTPREIEDRLEEAAYTLRNLPEKDRPRGYGSSWPPVVHDARHAYGYTPEGPMRVIPSAAAISRMEECFDWLLLLDPKAPGLFGSVPRVPAGGRSAFAPGWCDRLPGAAGWPPF